MLKRLLMVIIGVSIALALADFGYAFKENIVAAWTFDEGSGKKVADVSGNGNDGTIEGGAEWVDGMFGKALNFDGSTGFVQIPFRESLRVLNQGDFSFAAWYMANEIPSEDKHVLQQEDENGTGRAWIRIVENTGDITTFLGGQETSAGISIEANKWFHTAVVVTEGGDTDTIQLYVNGEPAGNIAQIGMEDCEGDFRIGTHKPPLDRAYWDGIIDEVVIFNTALSQAEIGDLMTKGIRNVIAVEPGGKLSTRWAELKR